jgi:uncharacterized protein (TIGR02300 family)
MAKLELGTKRSCSECGAKFYDLNKDPIVCPKCGAAFDLASLTMTSAAAKPREKPAKAEETDEGEANEAIVSLEDADAEEAATGRASPDVVEDDDVPDLEDDTLADDDEVKSDEFLEDDDEDDDVSVLIEGDIEDEED